VLQLTLDDLGQRGAAGRADAQAQIAALRSAGQSPTVSQALAGKATMDGFRAANAAFDMQLSQRREAELSAQTRLAVGLAAGLSIAMVLAGLVVVRQAARRGAARGQASQAPA
jgi:hypothetical protein